jgi:hypothetical protein
MNRRENTLVDIPVKFLDRWTINHDSRGLPRKLNIGKVKIMIRPSHTRPGKIQKKSKKSKNLLNS